MCVTYNLCAGCLSVLSSLINWISAFQTGKGDAPGAFYLEGDRPQTLQGSFCCLPIKVSALLSKPLEGLHKYLQRLFIPQHTCSQQPHGFLH